jgi:hypothetical protein
MASSPIPIQWAMATRILCVCGLLALVISGMAVTGTLDFTGLISGQTRLLETLASRESGQLIVLGSFLISGAVLLRRRWTVGREES